MNIVNKVEPAQDGSGGAEKKNRFASPFDVATPPGAEGWEKMFPYYALISPERRELEEGKFWFFDGMHNPEPLYPFDTIMTENWWVAASQMTAPGMAHPARNGHRSPCHQWLSLH